MFKKLLITIFIVTPLLTVHAEELAAPMANRNFEVAVNPLGILFNKLSAEFMFKVHDRVAIEIPVSFGIWYFGSTAGSFNWWSIYTGLGARIFLTDTAFRSGWYIEPMLEFGYSTFDNSVSSFVLSPWILAGYSWVWDSGLAVNLGAGLQYNYFTVTVADQPGWLSYPMPVVELSLGYTW